MSSVYIVIGVDSYNRSLDYDAFEDGLVSVLGIFSTMDKAVDYLIRHESNEDFLPYDRYEILTEEIDEYVHDPDVCVSDQ